MTALTLNDVSYKYESAKNQVLRNVSIEFETGKLYAIMGKSGAGRALFYQ